MPTELPAVVSGHVLIAGGGVSGRGIASLLAGLGVRMTLADDNPATRDSITAATGATTVTVDEAHDLLAEVDIVVTSPGWRPDSPLLVAAAGAGLEVIGDVELCYRLDRAGVFGAPRTWLVVTGTNGKTTTTGMLAAMMGQTGAREGFRAVACGNIGVAVADALSDPDRVDVLVAELSSFQLHWSSELVPDGAVLLNLADDHIDWHGSFEEYARSKAKVLQAPWAVAGIDDDHVQQYVQDYLTRSGRTDVYGFTLGEPATGQFGVVDQVIVDKAKGAETPLASAEGIEPAGVAGVLDALAAAAVARGFGATPEDIQYALADFHVDGHRGAVVHEANGVRWIDNSKATNPHAAHSALEGAGDVVWIAGGQLKGAAIDELIRDHAHQFRAVALLGVDRQLLADALAQHAPEVPVFVTDSTDPEAAMADVVRFAVEHAEPGDAVVLAPAAASLDMYTGMSQRGDLFAQAARTYAVIPEATIDTPVPHREG